MSTNYLSNILSQRQYYAQPNNSYNVKAFNGKSPNEQSQPLSNVAKMTINQAPYYQQFSNIQMPNYHYSQIERGRSLSTAKLPPQMPVSQTKVQTPFNQQEQQMKPNQSNQPLNYSTTINRNPFNSQYAYNGPNTANSIGKFAERQENNSLLSNTNYYPPNQNMNSTIVRSTPQKPFDNLSKGYDQFATISRQIIDRQPKPMFEYNPPNNNQLANTINFTQPQKKRIYSITKWSAKSLAGKEHTGLAKTNQDSYLFKEFISKSGINMNCIGVFDGHGGHGHLVSRAIKTFFSTLDLSNKIDSIPASNYYSTINNQSEQSAQLFNDKSYTLIKSIFNSLSSFINSSKLFDSQLSGSTCVVCFVNQNKLICANCGDSRAIMIQDNGQVVPLSRDHKPELPEEKKRIISRGGRVEKVPYAFDQGPYRVWLKYENYPGLAMSRSIGDQVAESVGVTPEPEMFEFDLIESKPKMIIVASDGVWEFLSNEDVAELAMPYYSSNDCDGAAKRITDVAQEVWKKTEPVCDDITAVVAFFTSITE